MAATEKNRLSDGFLSLESGVDAGKAPNLLKGNNVAWAINTTFRGGWPTPRPGWVKRPLTFNSNGQTGDLLIPASDIQIAFENGRFQCGGGYRDDSGSSSAISMHGGRVFKINLSNFSVEDISITANVGATLVTDYNNPNLESAWTCQAENFFLIQDGQSRPFIYTGATARRAGDNEIPVARQMVYYMGRIWLARGREYSAGDIVFGPSGTSTFGYRDSILKVTENTYLNEGGAFGVPTDSGEIVAMVPIANINTALGQGELLVFTQNNVFATLVPQDRAVWKNTSQPLQRVVQLSNGGFAQDSIVNVNEDLFYRSNDGIRSLAYSVRNSGQWGNVPISNEVTTILDQDAQGLLKFGSGVNFDNRFLHTVSPTNTQGHGVYHRALVALDFDLITGMLEKSPPAWEGIWTGLKLLKLFTVLHYGEHRCFAYVLNNSDKIELWELTTDSQVDNNGSDVRIQWSFDTRSMDFGNKFDGNRLNSADLFCDQVSGQVDFDIDYRPDSYPCWQNWDSWSECAKTSVCLEDITRCMTIPNFQLQYRPMRQLVQPKDDFDPILNKLYRVGYEFQIRFNITGYCRLKQFRANAYRTEEAPYGRQL
jgi:hypothetical protein